MARPAAPKVQIVHLAMDTQADLLRVQVHAAPLFEAALATGDWSLMSEVHSLAGLLKVARKQAKRIAGMADSMCADGIAEPGHGRAA